MTREEDTEKKKIDGEQAAKSSAKVSVIVPVYHVEKYLPACLDSILGQTFHDFELILINDGGSEEDTAICKRYAAGDSRIKYIEQENKGLSGARNTGLSQATGEWILFCDSDDWIELNTIEKCIKTAESANADMVIFGVSFSVGAAEYRTNQPLPEGVYDPETVLGELASLRLMPNAWNKFMRKKLIEGVEFPLGEHWEDVAVIHIPISRADRIYIIDDNLYHYLQRQDAITKVDMQNGSIVKWRFVQYSKRHDFLKRNYPENAALIEAAKPSVLKNGLKYAAYCLKISKDKEEYRKTRRTIMSGEFDSGAVSGKLKAVLFVFRYAPHVFRLSAERILRS